MNSSDRIKELEMQLSQKDKRIEVLKKALELATENSDNYWEEKMAIENKQGLYDYFIQQATKIEKGE